MPRKRKLHPLHAEYKRRTAIYVATKLEALAFVEFETVRAMLPYWIQESLDGPR